MKIETRVSDLGDWINHYTGNKIVNSANNAVGNAQEKVGGAVENAMAYSEEFIKEHLTKSIDEIYKSLGIDEKGLETLQNLISAGGEYLNTARAISAMVPADITFVPFGKGFINSASLSLVEIGKSIYFDSMYKVHALANQVMNQLADPLETLNTFLCIATEEGLKIADKAVVEFTGFHILEIYNMCIKGVQIYKTIKKLAKKEAVEDMVNKGVATVETQAESAKEQADETINSTKERGKDTWDNTKDQGKDALDNAKDQANAAKDQGKDTLDSAKEQGKDALNNAKEQGEETLESAKEQGNDALDSAKETLNNAKEKGKDTIDSIKGQNNDNTNNDNNYIDNLSLTDEEKNILKNNKVPSEILSNHALLTEQIKDYEKIIKEYKEILQNAKSGLEEITPLYEKAASDINEQKNLIISYNNDIKKYKKLRSHARAEKNSDDQERYQNLIDELNYKIEDIKNSDEYSEYDYLESQYKNNQYNISYYEPQISNYETLIDILKKVLATLSPNSDSYSNIESTQTNTAVLQDVKSTKKAVDITIDTATAKQQLYAELYAYIGSIAAPLQNAFYMLMIQDTLIEIKDSVERLTNISIPALAKSINTFDDIIMLLDGILNADPILISLNEAKSMGMNMASSVISAGKQAFDNAKNTDILKGKSWQSLTAGGIAMIKIDGVKKQTTTDIDFEMDQAESEKTGYFCITATLYKNPNKCQKQIENSFLNFVINGSHPFTPAKIKEVIKMLSLAWQHKVTNYKFPVQCIVDTHPRIFQFTVMNPKADSNNTDINVDSSINITDNQQSDDTASSEDSSYEPDLNESLQEYKDTLSDLQTNLNETEAAIQQIVGPQEELKKKISQLEHDIATCEQLRDEAYKQYEQHQLQKDYMLAFKYGQSVNDNKEKLETYKNEYDKLVNETDKEKLNELQNHLVEIKDGMNSINETIENIQKEIDKKNKKEQKPSESEVNAEEKAQEQQSLEDTEKGKQVVKESGSNKKDRGDIPNANPEDVKFMFDVVYSLISKLKVLQPVLKTFAELLENYKTNKMTCARHAQALLLKSGLKRLNKLIKHPDDKDKPNKVETADKENTNIYTVRTKEFSEFLNNDMKISPDSSTCKVTIEINDTNKILDTYKGEINKEQFIRDKKTILIFDTESIKDAIKNGVNKYKDGTYNNFDKVVNVPGTGMCHIINSNKNMETSEIIRAYKKLNSK